ncbi:cytochrome P450 [Cubamyces sp. BRFM 1775]|nr:cytochrome P450 [Cubamyces sp. BRFM 1775]
MQDLSTLILTGLAAVLTIHIVKWYFDPLRKIPTLGGPSFPLLSYIGVLRCMYGKAAIEEGYKKYYGSAFKIAMFDTWMVYVSGPELIDEMKRRPDDELSFHEGADETLQTIYTMGADVHYDRYHIPLVRDKLTRNLPAIVPDVIDEVTVAFQEYIPGNNQDWNQVDVLKTMRDIVARASNRVFIGLPGCRNQEYLDMAVNYTLGVFKDKMLLMFFPNFLKNFANRLWGTNAASVRRAAAQIRPVIEERRQKMAEYGEDWADKPNDMLQWIIEEAGDNESRRSAEAIIRRLFVLNFAAIHTSALGITQAVYHLSEHPEWQDELRQEVERVTAEDGWTFEAMAKMWKVDSFMRESLRYNGIGLGSLLRRAEKDIVLSNGTFIPRGTLLSAAACSLHRDETIYDDPDVFDPFRFARKRATKGEETRHQFVTASAEYLPFGLGRHACPGRFFASNELKAMLAYVVANYDVKFRSGGKKPENLIFAQAVIPSPDAEVLFRKRA